jgi:hypothetical protein
MVVVRRGRSPMPPLFHPTAAAAAAAAFGPTAKAWAPYIDVHGWVSGWVGGCMGCEYTETHMHLGWGEGMKGFYRPDAAAAAGTGGRRAPPASGRGGTRLVFSAPWLRRSCACQCVGFCLFFRLMIFGTTRVRTSSWSSRAGSIEVERTTEHLDQNSGRRVRDNQQQRSVKGLSGVELQHKQHAHTQ